MRIKSGLFSCIALAVAAVAVTVGFKQTPKSTTTEPQPTAKPVKEMTYAGGVAELLNDKCVTCHRAGDVAPMSFEGYENAKKYSKMIAYVTKEHKMPPWKTRPVDVQFHSDNHLSDDEIQLLGGWAEAGAPKGDADKIPPVPKFTAGWKLGKPDMVVSMPYEFTLGADGTDEYWNFVIKPDIKEPVYVSAMDVKPGNPHIVHHIIAFLDDKGRGEKLVQGPEGDKKAGYLTSGGGVGFNPDGSIGGWAPGATAQMLPPDAGFLLKPGTDIILQVHYNKSGKVEKDQSEIALYLNKGKVTNPVEIAWMANPAIKIPANDKAYTATQTITLPRAITIYSVMPHMHKLGHKMKASAELPDGKTIRLIDVQDWDFNWQLVYYLKQPLTLPKGTKINIEATYDNSADNPFNPHDPPIDITWGEKTSDEMMLLVVTYSLANKSESGNVMAAVARSVLVNMLQNRRGN